MQHQQMKERLKQEYRRRLRMIMKSELNARNKITTRGDLAVPILRYSFGIINWRNEEIKPTERKTRKMQQCIKCTIQKLTLTGYTQRGKERDDWYKLKQHIKQRYLILQNTLQRRTVCKNF